MHVCTYPSYRYNFPILSTVMGDKRSLPVIKHCDASLPCRKRLSIWGLDWYRQQFTYIITMELYCFVR